MDQGKSRWIKANYGGEIEPPSPLPSPPGCCARPLGVLRTATGEGERDEMMKNEPSRLRSLKPNPTKSNQIKPDQDGSRAILDPGAGRWIKTGAAELRF